MADCWHLKNASPGSAKLTLMTVRNWSLPITMEKLLEFRHLFLMCPAVLRTCIYHDVRRCGIRPTL